MNGVGVSEQVPVRDRETGEVGAYIAMILGVFGVCFAPVAVAGVGFGIASVVRSSRARKGEPAALSIFGLGVALLGLLLGSASLFMAMGSAAAAGRQTRSYTQLMDIGKALRSYAVRYSDQLPPMGSDWEKLLIAEGQVTAKTLVSPYSNGNEPSHLYVPPSGAFSTIPAPEKTVLVFTDPAVFHGNGSWILFADGHVDYVTTPGAWQYIHGLRVVDGTVFKQPAPK